MIELLLGMSFELSSDVHVFGALEHLRIDDVRDDSLIFTGQIFVQQLRELVAGDFIGFLFRHLSPPLDSKHELQVRALYAHSTFGIQLYFEIGSLLAFVGVARLLSLPEACSPSRMAG